jgi:hypothetical protein
MKKKSPHGFPKAIPLQKVLETPIATIYIYKKVVVVEAFEGVTLNYRTAFPILVAGLQHLGPHPWFYISHRVNSYALNPHDYKYLEKIPTLKALAIVATNELARQNAEMESNFFHKPFQIFSTMEEALAWGLPYVSPTKR